VAIIVGVVQMHILLRSLSMFAISFMNEPTIVNPPVVHPPSGMFVSE